MTSRRLIILGVLAILVIAGALLLARNPSSPSAETATAFYPALKKELDTVTAVRIFKAGDARAVELNRDEGGNWTVAERAGYPADTAKVHRLLRAIADAKPIEEKTSNPDNYATLSVEDITNPQAAGSRVELVGVATPVNLIIGKSGPGGQSTYVRRAGEPQSWLINASLDTSGTPDAWLRKEIINVTGDRIQSASVAIGNAKPYTAAKKARTDAEFAFDEVPKGKKIDAPMASSSISSALPSLTLTDVRPAKDFESEQPAARATFKTFDGLVVAIDGWTKDNKHYIALEPSYDEALAKQYPVETQAAETKPEAAGEGPPKPTEPASAPTAPAVNAQEEAKKAQAQLSGWVYEIPEYKYEAIFKPMDELVEKK